MKIGTRVKRLYIDHKGIKHLSLQSGTVIQFTDSYGYPAAVVHFDDYTYPSHYSKFTLREHISTNLLDELEEIPA